MFDFLPNLFKKTPGTGANFDIRPETERVKDYSFLEIVSSPNPVQWVEKNEDEIRTFPIQNQSSSFSCVAQALRKVLRVYYWLKYGRDVDFSATHIYQRRYNKGTGGMSGPDALSILEKGVTLNVFVPSDNMTEDEMNNYPIEDIHTEVGELFKTGKAIYLTGKSIDDIASVIQTTQKAVLLFFFFTSKEWSKEVPLILDDQLQSSNALRHGVAAVDFTLVDGEKALVIEDSAHFGGKSRRFITEQFFDKRCFFAAYPMNFKFLEEEQDDLGQKPYYTFTKTLEFIPLNEKGEISNPIKHAEQAKDVVWLQDILKFDGVFPKNITSSGYYGAITSDAVYSFQKKYKVADDSLLFEGTIVGPKTRAKLNALYGN